MSEPTVENPATISESLSPSVSDVASKPFVGRWHKLASETNWEKGRIILEWRNALIDAKASSSQYSDDAWANRVGFVTCQHVGRLRRVFERFGETYKEYPKLYWSHFWAAIDWDDAELWLEGASASRWSISQMCRMRAESMPLPDGQTPEAFLADEAKRIDSDTDDGFLESTSSAADATTKEQTSDASSERHFESSPLHQEPDFGGDADSSSGEAAASQGVGPEIANESINVRNPFEGLGKIPSDIVDALDPLKLCILRYRSNQWEGYSKQQMLDLIDALKAFCD